MKNILVIILVTLLAGCAASAMPNFVNGNYFMGGDESCKRYRTLSDTRIMCMDKNGTDTGYRDAMTDQQLQMYRHDQQMKKQEPGTGTGTGRPICYRVGGQLLCS